MRGRTELVQEKVLGEFEEKIVQINRVSKKTQGGNKIGFSALVVVGDKKGRVGVALGKAPDTLSAIRKGTRRARKELIQVPIRGTTIPFALRTKRGAAEVLIKPAPPGSGVIAGGAVRAVVELAGIRDIVAKVLGSNNKASNVYATFAALKEMAHLDAKKRRAVDSEIPIPATPPIQEGTISPSTSSTGEKKTQSHNWKHPQPTKEKEE